MINIRDENVEKAWKLYKELKKKIDGTEKKPKRDSKKEKREGKPEKEAPVCEACGTQMIPRQGKNGLFYGCANYPVCRNTKPFEEERELRVEDLPLD